MAEAVDLVGAETAARPGSSPSSLPQGRRAGGREHGFILADTKFELGYLDGQLVPLRRGAHPRLLALLAGRPVGAGDRTRPSFDKQPVRDWAGGQRTGTRSRRPPALPDEW